MFVALTHDYILFFTDKGKVYWLKVYDVPIATRTAGGRAIVNLLQLGEGERITGMVPVREFREDECLLMVTRRGTVKKTELVAFKRPLGRGIIALGLEENDELIGVARVKAGDHVILSTREGMSIRFDEARVRAMGRPAYGVKGIELGEGDLVIGMVVANGDDDPASLLTVCANGYGKRTLLTEYRSQNRGGKGLIDIQTSERNGPVVAVCKVTEDDEVMLTTSGGMGIRTPLATTRTIGRNTQGVRLIKLNEGDVVSSLAKLPEDEIGDSADLAPAGPFEPTEASNGDSESGSNGEVTLEAEDNARDMVEDGEIEPGEDEDSGAGRRRVTRLPEDFRPAASGVFSIVWCSSYVTGGLADTWAPHWGHRQARRPSEAAQRAGSRRQCRTTRCSR